MGLETATYIDQLVDTNPVHTDDMEQGDAHLRLIKSTLLATFANFTSAALASSNANIDAACSQSAATWAGTGAFTGNLSTGGNLAATGSVSGAGVTSSAGLAAAGPVSIGSGPVTVSASTYTVGATDFALNITTTCVLTLPTPASNAGRLLWIHAGFETVTSASSNVVQGANVTGNVIIGGTAANVVWGLFQCDGTNWINIGGDEQND